MKRRELIGLSLISTISWLTGGCRPSLPSAASRTTDIPHPDSPDLPASPRFRDVAAEVGLDYRWVIPGPRPLNILQTIGNGCAFLDFDNDGNLDILLVGPTLALFH
ncbi:MAG TPA: CRTAC1 family protein, partial [Chthonomonas sp.]|nr:CRTAC1 family protein [Chthonomonas sp.]